MKKLLLFLTTILSLAASAQGLIEHKATIETVEPIELRIGDIYKSKFELSGVFGYNGKLSLSIKHFIQKTDENGEFYWDAYRTTQDYSQSVTIEQLNEAWSSFSQAGIITLADNPKQQYEKAVAYYIANVMLNDSSMWYYDKELTDLIITVSE